MKSTLLQTPEKNGVIVMGNRTFDRLVLLLLWLLKDKRNIECLKHIKSFFKHFLLQAHEDKIHYQWYDRVKMFQKT